MNETFFEAVYNVVRQVPYGRVTTYGIVARCIGSPQAARMVGWALNKSSLEGVPAHRVVNRNGLLTGKTHFSTANTMQQLLEQEGIVVENNKIKNFEAVLWNPFEEK